MGRKALIIGHTAIAAAACMEQSLVDRKIMKTLAHTHNAVVGPMSIGTTGKAAVIGSILLMAFLPLQNLTKHS